MSSYLKLAIDTAVLAGAEILKIYETDFVVDQKEDHSPLTQADRSAHLKILSHLGQTPFPILSEEGKHLSFEERKKWNLFWLVDPLDGTKEFVKRNGEFTVNIALIEKGIPIIGVIYVPVTDTLYVGSEKGAFKYEKFTSTKSEPQKLPLPKGDRPYTIVGSRSHMSSETEIFFDEKKKKIWKC